MPSLKQVTMKAYTATEDELNFLKILIGQGVALQKIVLARTQVGEEGQIGERSLPLVVLYREGSQGWKCSWALYPATPHSIDSEL